MRDTNGQPTANFNAKLRNRRNSDEMIGICKGIISDGHVSQEEAEYLESWFLHNPDMAKDWPFNRLKSRLDDLLVRGNLSEAGSKELFQFLREITGGSPETLDVVSMSSKLPLDNPAPKMIFTGKVYCLTGKFIHGPRKSCEEIICEKGGIIADKVTLSTNYLVVGKLGSRDWLHTPYGTKIMKAMDYKARSGTDLAIVSELTFVSALQ